MAPQRAETQPRGNSSRESAPQRNESQREIHLETTLGNPKINFFSKLKHGIKAVFFFYKQTR
jgi:hypothetical protein